MRLDALELRTDFSHLLGLCKEGLQLSGFLAPHRAVNSWGWV